MTVSTAKMTHQYIDRVSCEVKNEKLFGDRFIQLIYCDAREKAPILFKALTSARMSSVLGFLNYDLLLKQNFPGRVDLLKTLKVDLFECLEPDNLTTLRKIFERKIRYDDVRPMPENPSAVVSPADAKMIAGSSEKSPMMFIKEKFFDVNELLGHENKRWIREFHNGSYAIFRLTPEKYHYNHTPVAGTTLDIYEMEGVYHSCNPTAALTAATPISKNRRVVTVIDTDTDEGTGVGLVAMVEVAALMIGDIRQCYSDFGYTNPRPVTPGLFLIKGQPKSIFKPGSSTVVLLFQKNKIVFSPDILANLGRRDVQSRFSAGLGQPVVETDVAVREEIATRKSAGI